MTKVLKSQKLDLAVFYLDIRSLLTVRIRELDVFLRLMKRGTGFVT